MSSHPDGKKKSRGPNRPTGSQRQRSFNAASLIRSGQEAVVEKFRALPPWARRESAAALVAFDPQAFAPTPVGQSVPKVAKVAKASSEEKAGQPTPEPPKTKPTAGNASIQDGTLVAAVAAKPAKTPKGWKRPEVCRLECSKRLGNPPSEYTKEQRQADLSLLSAALGAADRGRRSDVPPEVVAEAISSSRESPESFMRLWPSVKTRKLCALRSAKSLGLTKPDVRSVDDASIIYTPFRPALTVEAQELLERDRTVYESMPLPLANVAHHVVIQDQDPELISPGLIQRFLNKEDYDYTNLRTYIHLSRYDRFLICWVKSSLDGLKWGDREDNAIVSVPSPPPRNKKRKLTHDEKPPE
jgi:hypothetical protein